MVTRSSFKKVSFALGSEADGQAKLDRVSLMKKNIKLQSSQKSHSAKVYHNLSECLSGGDVSDDNTEQVFNFFGVIVDASYPHLAHNSSKYTCTVRLIDASMPLTDDGVVSTATVVFFGAKFEDMPVSQRVGDIIRVHRATLSTYRDMKHFTANLCFNAAWCLFSPSPKKAAIGSNNTHLGFMKEEDDGAEENPLYRPMQHFGKNYSPVEPKEQRVLGEMREWIPKVFAKHSVLDRSRVMQLSEFGELQEKKEVDLLVRVCQIFKRDH